MVAEELTDRGIVALLDSSRDLGAGGGESDARECKPDLGAGDGEILPFPDVSVRLLGKFGFFEGGEVVRIACDDEVA